MIKLLLILALSNPYKIPKDLKKQIKGYKPINVEQNINTKLC